MSTDVTQELFWPVKACCNCKHLKSYLFICNDTYKEYKCKKTDKVLGTKTYSLLKCCKLYEALDPNKIWEDI